MPRRASRSDLILLVLWTTWGGSGTSAGIAKRNQAAPPTPHIKIKSCMQICTVKDCENHTAINDYAMDDATRAWPEQKKKPQWVGWSVQLNHICVHAYVYACIHAYIRICDAYIHACIHAYMHVYTHMQVYMLYRVMW